MNLPYDSSRPEDMAKAVHQLTLIYSKIAIRVFDLEKRMQELEARINDSEVTGPSTRRADA